MSEQEPIEEFEEQVEDSPESIERFNQSLATLIELVETKESYSGHLEDEEKADLIGGLRNLTFLDSHTVEEREEKEYLLDIQDLCGEIYGLLEQYGIPAEEAMTEADLLE